MKILACLTALLILTQSLWSQTLETEMETYNKLIDLQVAGRVDLEMSRIFNGPTYSLEPQPVMLIENISKATRTAKDRDAVLVAKVVARSFHKNRPYLCIGIKDPTAISDPRLQSIRLFNIFHPKMDLNTWRQTDPFALITYTENDYSYFCQAFNNWSPSIFEMWKVGFTARFTNIPEATGIVDLESTRLIQDFFRVFLLP